MPARLKPRLAFPIIERFRPNSWYASVLTTANIGSSTLTASANRLYAMLFPVPKRALFDKIALRVYSGGDLARLGIYKADDEIYPSELMIDAGEVSVLKEEIDIDVTLAKGYYFLSFILNADTVLRSSVRYITPIKEGEENRIGYWIGRSYGPLPNTYPTAASYEPYLFGISLRFIKHV